MTITEARRQIGIMAEKLARNGLEIMGNNNSNNPILDVVELFKARDESTEELIALQCSIEKAIIPICDILLRVEYYKKFVSFLSDVKKDFYNVSLRQAINPQLGMTDIEDMICQTEQKILSLQAEIDDFESSNEVEGLISTEQNEN